MKKDKALIIYEGGECSNEKLFCLEGQEEIQITKNQTFPGSFHLERACDGRDGAGDQHDRDPDADRRAEQAGEGGGKTISQLLALKNRV